MSAIVQEGHPRGIAADVRAIAGDTHVAQVRDFLHAEQEELPPANPVAVLLRAMRGRWRMVILLTVLLAPLLAAAGYFTVKPIFQSAGLIRIIAREPKILYADADDSRLRLYDAFVAAEMDFLSSRPVYEGALEKLRAQFGGAETVPPDVGELAKLIDANRKKGLITVAVKHPRPVMAAAIVNAMLDSYLYQHDENDRRESRVREQELAARERELLTRLRGLNDDLLATGQEHDATSLAKAHVNKLAQLDTLQQRIEEVENTVAQMKTSGGTTTDTGDVEIKRAILLDQAMADMTYERAQRDAALESLRERYRPGHPRLRDAQLEIAALDSSIEQRRQQITTLGKAGALTGGAGANAEDTVAEMEALDVQLKDRLEVLRVEAQEFNTRLVNMAFLTQERDGVRILLEETRRALDKVRVESRNSLPGTVEIVSRGVVPDRAFQDKRKMAAAGGMAGAGFIALVIVLGWSLTRGRLRFTDDIGGEARRLKILAVLPKVKGDPSAAITNAAHRVRNALDMVPGHVAGARRIIAVTGAAKETGATAVARALAASSAAAGRSTLLVDADFDHTGLTEELHLQPQAGLREAVLGLVPVSGSIVAPAHAHEPAVMPAGISADVSAETLTLDQFRAVLMKAEETHDVIVVDVGTYRDGYSASLAVALADEVIVVAAAGQSAAELKHTAEVIQKKAPGRSYLVFNKAGRNDPALPRDAA